MRRSFKEIKRKTFIYCHICTSLQKVLSRVGNLCECDPLMKLYDPLLKRANDPLLNFATLF